MIFILLWSCGVDESTNSKKQKKKETVGVFFWRKKKPTFVFVCGIHSKKKKNGSLPQTLSPLSFFSFFLSFFYSYFFFQGIFHLVGAIKEKKDQLWALDLTHNNIYQQGISALEEVICEEEGKGERGEERLGLVKLRVEQMGIPLNEISLERLRRKVKLNWRKFSGKEREVREECLYPTHLREIASVYRVNGRYKGDE